MRFVLVCFWVVCVFNLVHATDVDEHTPLLACQGGRNTSWEAWEQKIDQARSAQGHVWVVYLPKEGGQYCLTCDVREETYKRHCRLGPHQFKTIQPLMNVLGDQFLRGLHVKPEMTPPPMDVDFGIRDVTVSDYTQERFLSANLKTFLCRVCRHLQKKGKAVFDGFAQALTEDMWRGILPRFQTLRWSIEGKPCLLAAANQEVRDAPSIFMVVGHYGILKGELEKSRPFLRASEEPVEQSSLFDYKLEAVWRNWQKMYTSSREGYTKY